MKCVYLTLLLVIFNPPQYVKSATIGYGIATDGSSLPKKLAIPAMAQKSGGSWRPELMPGASDKLQEPTKEQSYTKEDEDDYYDSEEIDCPRNMFFHIRSKICVPFKCPRDTKRDKESGRCVKEYFNLNNRSYYYKNRSSYVPRGGQMTMSRKVASRAGG